MGRLGGGAGGQGGVGIRRFIFEGKGCEGGGIMRGLKRMYKIMNLNINNGSLSYNHQNNF